MVYDTKDMLQNVPSIMCNTRHGVTNFIVHEMVRDPKYLISREQSITFP